MVTDSNIHIPSADFVAKLRKATGPMHKRLEETPLSRMLMQDDLTMADYINYLTHMREVVAWSEQYVFPVVNDVVKDIAERKKLTGIDNDLATLRSKYAIGSVAAFKGFDTVTESLGHALGHMYVMEGATLGGRMILQHVQKTLGLDEHTGGTCFFAGYGAETGSRWKSFMLLLTEQVTIENIENDVISGAVASFEQIEEYFAGSTVCR